MGRFFPDEYAMVEQFYMTKDEIRSMHKAGMLIGSHTVSHPVMSKLSPDEQRQEIECSFEFLHGIVDDLDMRTFCYPYGGLYSFTDDTKKLLDQNNCTFSFNVEARDITETDLLDNKHALPRYDCNLFPYGTCRNL